MKDKNVNQDLDMRLTNIFISKQINNNSKNIINFQLDKTKNI